MTTQEPITTEGPVTPITTAELDLMEVKIPEWKQLQSDADDESYHDRGGFSAGTLVQEVPEILDRLAGLVAEVRRDKERIRRARKMAWDLGTPEGRRIWGALGGDFERTIHLAGTDACAEESK